MTLTQKVGVYYLILEYLYIMKIIITEQQLTNTIKKFKKDGVNRGKLGHIIEEIVLSFFKRPICDVVAVFLPDTKNLDFNYYMVLILTPDGYSDETRKKIENRIENYVGEKANVIISQSSDCEKIESSTN
jgi:hypothetical protein